MLIRAYIGVSLDGFVATPDGAPAWSDRFDPRAYGHDEFMRQIAAVVMGRTTFDQARSTFRDAWPWKGKEVYVLTSRPLSADPPRGVTAWHGGAPALLAHLRAAHLDRDVELLGGPRTIQAFRELGAVDRLELYLLPVLLGDGIPLFAPKAGPQALRLDRHRSFSDGTVELVYSPASGAHEKPETKSLPCNEEALMLGDKEVIATIAVKDLKAAKRFYEGTLGLELAEDMEPEALVYKSGRSHVLVYASKYAGTNKATAATWVVGDALDKVVQALKAKGVAFEHYDLPDTARQGDVHVSGRLRNAWLKDPDGNILALVSQ